MEKLTLAERLKAARKFRGWTQTELARRADLHNVQLSKLERGTTKEMSTATLKALCVALGIGPRYFLGMTDDMESDLLPIAA